MSMSMMHFFKQPYKAKVNLRVMAGVAKPNPKMGQSLGPLGVNMMQFCKEFNAKTGHVRADVPLRVVLYAFADRTFKFIVKPPATSFMMKKAMGVPKLSKMTKHIDDDTIGLQYVYEIAKLKKEMDPDLKHVNLQSICKMIVAQCGSMGVGVLDDPVRPHLAKIPLKI